MLQAYPLRLPPALACHLTIDLTIKACHAARERASEREPEREPESARGGEGERDERARLVLTRIPCKAPLSLSLSRPGSTSLSLCLSPRASSEEDGDPRLRGDRKGLSAPPAPPKPKTGQMGAGRRNSGQTEAGRRNSPSETRLSCPVLLRIPCKAPASVPFALSVSLSLCRSVCLCLSLCLCLSISLSLSLSVSLCVSRSLCLFLCRSVSMSLSVACSLCRCLCFCLCFALSLARSVYLCSHVPIWCIR